MKNKWLKRRRKTLQQIKPLVIPPDVSKPFNINDYISMILLELSIIQADVGLRNKVMDYYLCGRVHAHHQMNNIKQIINKAKLNQL